MKFICQRDLLMTTLSTVARAVSTRSTLPILANVLLEAEDETLQLTATDNDLVMVAKMPVQVDEAGRTTLPARFFSEVVGVQPAGQLEVRSDTQDHVTLLSGGSEMELSGLPAEEFPPPVELVSDHKLILGQRELKSMIGSTILAVGQEETRHRLTGILFQLEGAELRLVATDTHRLATLSQALQEAPASAISAIIPARSLRELERLLADDTAATIEMRLTEGQVQFVLEGVVLTSRLIEGEFPNYKRIIPTGHAHTLTFETATLREAVRRCALFARDEGHKMILTLGPDDKLNLKAVTRAGSSSQETTMVDHQATESRDDDLRIAFNSAYMLDVLNHLKCEHCQLGITSGTVPGMVKPIDESNYQYVIMPMQID